MKKNHRNGDQINKAKGILLWNFCILTICLASPIYIYVNPIEVNTCTYAHMLSTCKAGEICIRLVDCINVNFLAVIYYGIQDVSIGETGLRVCRVSLYYFLQVHLQVPQHVKLKQKQNKKQASE